MTPEDFSNRFIAVASGLLEDCPQVSVGASEARTAAARRAALRVLETFSDRITWVPPPITVAAIEAEVVRTGAKVCVIDYVQKIDLPDGGKDRTSDIDKIVGMIRDMTERHDLATIMISSMAKTTAGMGSHLGQLGRNSADIGHAVEIGYEAVMNRDAKGNPIKDDEGFSEITWRCAGARNLESSDLVLRFRGRHQTYYGDPPVPEYEELGADAFAVGHPR
jgi:hypothetical protein